MYLYCSLFIQCQCYKSQYCIEVITSYSFADISEPIPPLELSPRVVVENSPGLKPGTPVLCERVRIHGLSRIHHLRKLSHSANVKVVSKSSSPLHPTKFEVCFHRWVICIIQLYVCYLPILPQDVSVQEFFYWKMYVPTKPMGEVCEGFMVTSHVALWS